MTKDEKAIWIAVFAARNDTIAAQTGKARMDCAMMAIEEADYTILTLRRIASGYVGVGRGHLHHVKELIEEEEHGRGVIEISELQDLGFAP